MLATDDEFISISKKEYDELQDHSLWLQCLEGAGVDNWVGYDYAVENYKRISGVEEED